jgi:hypothetical protein
MQPVSRRLPLFVFLVVTLIVRLSMLPLAAQTQSPPPKPAPKATPGQARPAQTKPAPPTKTAASSTPKTEPEPAKPAAPPLPQDVRFKSMYTSADLKTESVTYIKGERERFEFQDMVLLKQHDQKRTVQISKSANTYLISPDGMTPPSTAPGASAPPKSGVVMVATTVVDTGERKAAFGQQARHVKIAIDKQPMAGACDTARQRIEIDGWYIDTPNAVVNQAAPAQTAGAPAGDCADQIQSTSNGDWKALGFPIGYTSTVTGDDGKPVIARMEVTEFEQTTLDASLFEIPAGLNAAMNVRELSKALSDANEAKLAAFNTDSGDMPPAKTPGVLRIGVPEFSNKTTQTVDTRALRQRLVASLVELKIDAVPMAAATPEELQMRARQLECDYVLMAEIVDLKASKPGPFGGLMKAASGAGGGSTKENTESTIALKLVQPDGKARLQTTTKGKDGSGFSLQTGLGLAKFAGGMYLTMFAGPQMFARLNGFGGANLSGMGLIGNPMLYQMQASGLSGFGKGAGLDATAGAASFLMQQAMTMNNQGGYVGAPGSGPSFDESLGEALQNAAKAVQKAVQQK